MVVKNMHLKAYKHTFTFNKSFFLQWVAHNFLVLKKNPRSPKIRVKRKKSPFRRAQLHVWERDNHGKTANPLQNLQGQYA